MEKKLTRGKEIKVKTQYMVLARHYGMTGGVWDYGTADIKEFFDDYKEADTYAQKLFNATHKNLIMPFVWVLECKKTYQEGGIAVSERLNPQNKE